MQNTLFSTYRQGENRVTSSFLALLERVTVKTFNQIFNILLQDSNNSIITINSQYKVSNSNSVPDASISFPRKVLIETKTEIGQIKEKQLQDHLEIIDPDEGSLVVLSPDLAYDIRDKNLQNDGRLIYSSFHNLNQGLRALIEDKTHFLYENETMLIEEFMIMMEKDNLLPEDVSDKVIIVPAKRAYHDYKNLGMYVCQPNRSFQPASRIGFYKDGSIQKEVPRILAVAENIVLKNISTDDIITKREDKENYNFEIIDDSFSKTDLIDRMNELINSGSIKKSRFKDSESNKIFILTKSDNLSIEEKIPKKIINDLTSHNSGKKVAYTQNQRYSKYSLMKNESFTSRIVK